MKAKTKNTPTAKARPGGATRIPITLRRMTDGKPTTRLTPAATRPFGIDTVQQAVGRLPASMVDETLTSAELELAPEDYEATLTLLAHARTQGNELTVGTVTRDGIRLAFDAGVESANLQRRLAARAVTPGPEHIEFTVTCRLPSKHQTVMTVTLRIDPHARRWINIRANPTPFLAGHNSYAAVIADMSSRQELGCLLRLPFDALAGVLRRVDPFFAWHKNTRRKIRSLLFRITNVQLFTYLTVAEQERGRLLGFLRCLMSVPFGDGNGRYRLLRDALDVRVDDRCAADVETLLLICQAGKRPALSINLYEKDRKVAADGRSIGANRCDLAGDDRLRNAIRLDLTMHVPALLDLFREAGIKRTEEATLIAANFVKAVRRLERGKGRSGKSCLEWLLDYAFEQRLPLLKLLAFKPSLLNKARKVLTAYNPKAAEAFYAWWSNSPGTRDDRRSFVRYAMTQHKSKLSRHQARKTRAKLLALGIDPDVPADAYLAFFGQTFVWDMTRKERIKYCRALEVRNSKIIAKYMARSRARSESHVDQVSEMLRAMLASAGAPAVVVPIVDMSEPRPVLRSREGAAPALR